jgi:uncharacterized protein YggE
MISLFFAAALAGFQGQLIVTEEAGLSMKPDHADIVFAVVTKQKDPGPTLAENNASMEKALARLKELGIEEKCIKTSGFTFGRFHDRDAMVYMATNTVYVTVHKTPDVGKILDELVKSGVTDIQSVSFGISESRYKKEDLEKAAVQKAMAKAERLAGYANMRLGSLKGLQVGRSKSENMYSDLAAAMPSRGVPVEAGDASVNVSVTLTYDLISLAAIENFPGLKVRRMQVDQRQENQPNIPRTHSPGVKNP